MPLYEFLCKKCEAIIEVHRSVARRDDAPPCACGAEHTVRIYSSPTVQAWDPERPYPNLSSEGDGTMRFPSRAAYEAHLKERGIHELDPSRFGMEPSVGRKVIASYGPKPPKRRPAVVS